MCVASCSCVPVCVCVLCVFVCHVHSAVGQALDFIMTYARYSSTRAIIEECTCFIASWSLQPLQKPTLGPGGRRAAAVPVVRCEK